MVNDIIVRTNSLSKTYGSTTVVDNLNLAVPKNQVFGLLGPNGAGKTTSILMLMGLTEPTSGTVSVGGFNPVTEPTKVKRITGYMPERLGFYENLTAWQNLDIIAELNGLSLEESQHRSVQILKSVGLDEAVHKKVGKFSRGMKQRLGLADVLIKRPAIAILDEPTAGLDIQGVNEILDLIANLSEAGTTVIMCSHRLYEVQKVCNSVGILDKGKLIAQGTMEELSKQAMSRSQYRIVLETSEPASELIEIIRKAEGVISVQAEGRRLTIDTQSDISPDISKLVVQNNFSLLQIRLEELNLEDIYLSYFREGSVQ